MIAAAGYLGYVGWKCYTTTRAAARFHVAPVRSNDRRAGGPDRGGSTRPAAHRRYDRRRAALDGAARRARVGPVRRGRQAETQLAAAAAVLPLRRAFVYSRSEERRTLFAEKMQARLGVEVMPVDRPQEAAEDLPIVITATTSSTPVFDGTALSEGTVVCAVGANSLSRAEIDTTTVRRADTIVCDSVAACRGEAGDFADAIEKGVFDWSRAVDLSDVVVGRAIGRPRRRRGDFQIRRAGRRGRGPGRAPGATGQRRPPRHDAADLNHASASRGKIVEKAGACGRDIHVGLPRYVRSATCSSPSGASARCAAASSSGRMLFGAGGDCRGGSSAAGGFFTRTLRANRYPKGPARIAGRINKFASNVAVNKAIVMQPKRCVGVKGLSAKTDSPSPITPSFDTSHVRNDGRRPSRPRAASRRRRSRGGIAT